VVVGDVGTGARQEPLAVGETPHIAARLQHLASSNTLVISAVTYQLIEGYFTCEALGEQALRGLAQPLRVYRVLRASGVQSRLEVAAARGLTPLVGRAPEVGLLRERWAQVKAGRGQVVVLAGEAGIGKSRLVQVLKDHVAHEAHLCWECRGVAYYQHTALYPLTACLQHWLQWQPGAAPAAALAQLERRLTQAQLALPETVPLFADLVALPLPAERYPPRVLPPEQQRQRTLEAVVTLVSALTEQQPVLLIVEDLHWVDPSTLELLTLLLDQAPMLRLYTVLTCRPTFQPPWGFRTHLTPIVLNRLTRSHVEDMLGGILRRHHLPAGVREQIVAQTDGIPLFVEEVTKAVVEAGHDTEAQHQEAVSGPVPAVGIPATLQEALMARLDRLGRVKGVAQLGATLGRQFPYALLRAVAPLADEALQRDLAALVAAELLYQRGQPPQALYTFKHALIQEAAYASVLQRVRRQTHHHIVEVLEAHFPETVATTPAVLAYHALRGEQWEKAVTYFRQAGDQALARSAYREAGAAFEQALGAVQHLPDTPARLAQTIDLRLALRNALWPLGELERNFVSLQDAHTCAELLGDQHRLGWVAAYLLAHFVQVGDADRALASGQRALAIAADVGQVGLTATVQGYVGMAYRSVGDYPRAVEYFRKNVVALQGASHQERFGLHTPPAVLARSFLVLSLAATLGAAYTRAGRTAEALVLLEQAIAQAVAMRYMVDYALRVVWLGEAYLVAGRWAAASTQAQRALAFARAHQERGHTAYTLRLLGAIAAQRTPPEPEQAAAHYRQALALAEELGMRPLQAHCHRSLGLLAATIGQAEQARSELTAAIALYQSMDMTFWLPQTEAALVQVEGR
jgi:tetratricopeptide (TPR) repeat protein